MGLYARRGVHLSQSRRKPSQGLMVTPDMMTAWMASPTHRANIMNGGFSQIGVAVVNGRLDGVETTLVVQMFGTPPTTQQVAQVTPEAPVAELPTLAITQPEVVSLTEVALGDSDVVAQPPAVLAGQAVPVGAVQPRIIYSPLHLAKAAALAMVILVVSILL